MPTCATFTVLDHKSVFNICRPHDGYPDGKNGVIRSLTDARGLIAGKSIYEAGDVAAALIAVMKQTANSVSLVTDFSDFSNRAYHYQIMCSGGGLHVVVKRSGEREFDIEKQHMRMLFQGSFERASKHFEIDV